MTALKKLFPDYVTKQLQEQRNLGGVIDLYRFYKDELNPDQVTFFHNICEEELDITNSDHQVAFIILAVEENNSKWFELLWNHQCYEACLLCAAWCSKSKLDDKGKQLIHKIGNVQIKDLNLNNLIELTHAVDAIFNGEVDGLVDVVEKQLDLVA